MSDVLTSAGIRAQLERVLTSKTFARAGRQAQLLRFIVERRADGELEPAKEYTLAVDVFARGKDYDPQIDSVVRVEASKLRIRLAKYYESEGKEDPIRIEIPRGAYAPLFHDQAPQPRCRALPSRRAWLYAGGAGAAMIASALLLRPRPGVVPAPAPPLSIAVLPFTDLSPGRDQAFFCEGVTEELTHALGRTNGLRVRSAISSSQYGGGDVNITKVGAELTVGAVLKGSVRREGNHIRFTAQLIETRGGVQLWSKTYDREMTGVLEVQREIAEAVAREFHIELTGGRRALVRPHSPDIDAYQFYLRAAHLAAQGDPESIAQAVEHYRMALAEDSRYGLAWAGLSLAYATLFDLDMAPSREILANCRKAALTSVSLGPELAESRQAMGRYLLYGEWDWNGAAAAFRKAMQLDRSYIDARYEYARTLNLIGRHDSAIEVLRRGIELDPTSNRMLIELGNSYIKAGRYDEAAEPLTLARRLVKRSVGQCTMLGTLAIGKEQYAEAISHFEEALRINPELIWPQAYRGYCYAKLGQTAKAAAVLKKLEGTESNRALPEFEIGVIYAGLGQTDYAFEWLERAFRRRSSAMAKIAVDIRTQSLRHDPRFVSLLKRMRLGDSRPTPL